MKNKQFHLSVDYDEPQPNTYRGIVAYSDSLKDGDEIIRVNTGDLEVDYQLVINVLCDYIGENEVNARCLSSFDNYKMDLDYQNDPKYREDVDKCEAELTKKIEDYKRELGKDELTIEEFNYIVNKRD